MANPFDEFDTVQRGANPFDAFDEEKPKTSFTEDLKIGAGKTGQTVMDYLDLVAGGLAGIVGKTDDADEIFKRIQTRKQDPNAWANAGQGKDQGFLGGLVSAVPQVAAFPFSPAETGISMSDSGEKPSKAVAGAMVDTAGNLVGVAMPGAVGNKLLTKVGTGASINVAQDFATKKAIQAIADKEETKKNFEPTLEGSAQAAVMGGVMGMMVPSGGKPKAQGAEPTSKIGSIIADEKAKAEVVPPKLKPADVYHVGSEGVVFDPKTVDPTMRRRVLDAQTQREMDSRVKIPAEHQPIPTEAQSELLPSYALQYGIEHSDNSGHWSKDENGMPIRTDLSMEAQQLQNPLQMNLWGDELAPAQGFEHSLTDSITPENAGALKDAVEATPEMDAALNRANPDLPQVELPSNPTSSGSPILNQAETSSSYTGRGNFFSNNKPGRLGKQRGAIDFQAIVDGIRNVFGKVVDSKRTPTTKTTIEAKQLDIKKLQALKEKLPEWTDVGSLEEATYLGEQAKDIKSSVLGQVVSNLNNLTAYHNNPILRYARKLFTDARFEQSDAVRTYITNKKTGLAKALNDLNGKEAVRVNDVLTNLDKNQVEYTPELGVKLGLSAKEQAAVVAQRKVAAFQLEWNNKTRVAKGLKPIEARPGYTPSILRGDFKAVVLDKHGNAIGFIGADTPGEFMKSKALYEQSNPGARFTANTPDEARKVNTGNRKGFVYQDFQEALKLLADADPNFGKVQAEIESAINQSATDLYNFDVHSKIKKGIPGARGDKPWLSPERNTKDRFDSMIKFYEEAFAHHSLQKPIIELNLLSHMDQLQHQQNTFKYLDKYLKNTTGGYTNGLGRVFDSIFDEGHKLLEIIPVLGKHMGPSQTIKMTNLVRNKMSQHFMGWFNWMFTASQVTQPLQTVIPAMQLVNNRLGNKASISAATTAGFTNAIKGFLKDTGYDTKMPVHMEAAYDYARKAGMFDFSELEKAYEGHKSTVGRTYDNIAEMSMRAGEQGTRGPMFLAWTQLLHDNGYTGKEALRTAENLTNMSMIDYHPWERPMLYSGLGVMGSHVGALRTFVHGATNINVLLAKEMKKNPKPILTSVAVMLALAGVSGMPFYNDLDSLYGEVTELLGHRSNISNDFLQNWEQWIKTGIVSDAMGLNMQGKFSSGNMIPDTRAEALAPQLSGAYDIADAAIEQLMYNDTQSQSNLAVAATPQGWKQATRSLVKRDKENNLLDKNMNVVGQRTDKEWRNSSLTGLAPQREAVQRSELYQNAKNQKADQDKRASITKDFDRALRTDGNIGSIMYEYIQAGGDPGLLLKRIKNVQVQQQMSEQLRLMGIPSNYTGVKKYQRMRE